MNVISRGIRNAFRNTIRTFSIVIILGLSIGLSLTMLIAHQAVGKQINAVEASIGNTVSISPAGYRDFQGGGNPLTEANLASVASLPHVVSTVDTLSDRLTTSDSNLQAAISAGELGQRSSQNSGESITPPSGGFGGQGFGGGSGGTFNFTPPVTVNGTNDPSNLSASAASGGGTFTLKAGSVFNGNSSADVALLGSTLAAKNNLKVGSTFTAYSTPIKVIGIFDAGNTFANNQVIMPLKAVQTLSDQTGDLTGITLSVDSLTNVSSVTSAATKVLGSAADVVNVSAQADQTIVSPLQNTQSISLYSLVGAVVAGAIIILLTMIMIVRERRREIGVIKAIGGSNLKVMGQFMVESVTFTLMAAVIGILLGVIAGNPITKFLVNNSTSTNTTAGGFSSGGGLRVRGFGSIHRNFSSIHAVIGWSIIAYGLAAAIIIAIIGSGLASWFIAKIRPAEVMRVE